jgi:outer membrane protein
MWRKRFILLGCVLFLLQTGFAAEPAVAAPQLIPKLTLEDCLKLGMTNSRNLQIAAKNVRVAQESVREAEAALGVKVGYNANQNYNDESGPSNSASVSLDLPVFTHGKAVKSLKVARLELEIAREDERQAKIQLVRDIKTAFYDLWLKEQQLAVAQASYANLGQHYNTIQKYCEVGKKAEYELLEAEVAWKQQKAVVTSALSNVALAKLDLATLIGIDPDQNLQIVYDVFLQQVPAQFQPELKTLLDQAFQQRPDLCQTVCNIKIAELNVAIAKTNKLPNLTLGSNYSDSDKKFQWTLGVSGTLYDDKETSSKVKAAEEKVAIAQVNDAKAREEIRQRVQKVFQNISIDLENAQSHKANIELTKEDLRLTEIRYHAGMSTIMDVKDRQLALDKSQNDYYQAVASYVTDLAQLDLELGNQSGSTP